MQFLPFLQTNSKILRVNKENFFSAHFQVESLETISPNSIKFPSLFFNRPFKPRICLPKSRGVKLHSGGETISHRIFRFLFGFSLYVHLFWKGQFKTRGKKRDKLFSSLFGASAQEETSFEWSTKRKLEK
jgi:hypothetical protein